MTKSKGETIMWAHFQFLCFGNRPAPRMTIGGYGPMQGDPLRSPHAISETTESIFKISKSVRLPRGGTIIRLNLIDLSATDDVTEQNFHHLPAFR